MRRSPATTRSARTRSPSTSARVAPDTATAASRASARRPSVSSSSWTAKADRTAWSAEAAGDVPLGPGVVGLGEDLLRRVVLDEQARALTGVGVGLRREEGGAVRDAGRLLHVVRDDDDRVVALELLHEVLDLRRGD